MAELRLRRDPEDRKRYVIEGVGELRLGKWYQRGAVVSSESDSWELSSRTWSSGVTATDAGGAEVATYEPRGALKRGGEIVITKGGETFELRPSSNWRNRYALWSGDTELAAVETKGWSGQEVAVDLSDDRSVDPLVLLMACYLVRRFGEDEAGGGATAAAS